MESFLPEIPLLPTNAAGEYGEKVDGLLHFVTYIITPWTLLAFGLILLFCLIYRRQQDKAAQYVDSHETLFTAGGIPIPRTAIVEVPTLIVLGLDLWIFFSSVMVWGDLKIDRPEPDANVQVVAKQFGWDFYYPGENDELDTSIERSIRRGVVNGEDRAQREVSVNEGDDVQCGGMVVQAGDTIGLKITSKDVIHSLFIPNLRFKQDAVPGRNIDAWVRAEKPTRPTYLENKILEQLQNAVSVAEEHASGEGDEQISTMKETLSKMQKQCDVKDAVPNYSSLESTFDTFEESAEALDGNSEKLNELLSETSTLFDQLQANERPYYRNEFYTIGCAELCGTGHSGMTAQLRVLPNPDEDSPVHGTFNELYENLSNGELNYGAYFQ